MTLVGSSGMSDRLAKAHRRSVEVLSVRPDLAQISNRVSARVEDGVTCKVTAGDHSVTVDLPDGAGGFDRGPTPSELIASALAACLTQGYVAMAAHEGIQLDGVEVTVEGEFDARGMYGIDPQIPAGFAKLDFTASLQSPESPERIAELHESVLRHSPVFDDLTRRLEIDGNCSHQKTEQ